MSDSGKQTPESKIASGPSAESAKSSNATATTTTTKRGRNPAKRGAQSAHSDGTLVKNVGLKQKLVNKVKSWNARERRRFTHTDFTKDLTDLSTDFEALTLSPEASDDNLFKSDWLKARDSLENLLATRSDKSEIVNSKSTNFPSSSEKPALLSESACSESQIGTSNKALNSVSRVLAWDPWDKLGRKNKKENKRRKSQKSPSEAGAAAAVPTIKDHTSGDELRNGEAGGASATSADASAAAREYEYRPYHKQPPKAVEFINEVMVVYITGGEVVGESTEPLKKELDQQIRNKEMRRGHYPATLVAAAARRKIDADDYMSAWLKK